MTNEQAIEVLWRAIKYYIKHSYKDLVQEDAKYEETQCSQALDLAITALQNQGCD